MSVFLSKKTDILITRIPDSPLCYELPGAVSYQWRNVMIFQVVLDVAFGINNLALDTVISYYAVGPVIGKCTFAHTKPLRKFRIADKAVAIEHRA